MQVVSIIGTQTTSVWVTDKHTVVQGQGPDVSRLVANHSAGPVVIPYNPAAPNVIDVLEVRDLTLDCNGGLTCLGVNALTIKKLVVRNVRFEHYTAIGLAASGGPIVDADGLDFRGAGTAMQTSGVSRFSARNFVVASGKGGFIKSDDGQPGNIELRDGRIVLDYWNRPGTETTATVSGLVVTPVTMPATPGLYMQVRMLDAAGEIVLGRVMSWTSTTLTVQRWRRVDNTDAPTPADGECRVIPRHPDVGGIHITAGPNAMIERVEVRGGWSDMITVRGSGCVLRDCRTLNGQDMGFTVDGVHTLERCVSDGANFDGFIAITGGAHLYDCEARGYGATFSNKWAPWGSLTRCKSC